MDWYQIASEMGIEGGVKEGVYVKIGGPNYETVAELKMLRALGVDSVGKKLLLIYRASCSPPP